MKHTLLFSLLLIFSMQSHSKIEPLDKIIVVVNDDVITQHELDSRTEEYKNKLRLNNLSEQDKSTLTKQVLQKMIRTRIQLQRAKKLGITIDDVALNRVLEKIAGNNNITLAELGNTLKADGISFSSFREQTRSELIVSQLQQRMVASKVTVTDQEIQQFINTNKSSKHPDISYHLSHILLSTPESAKPEDIQIAKEKADKLHDEIMQGGDFADIALRHSNGRNALKGGDLGWRKANELPIVFINAINNLQDGDVSKPVRSASGFHILKINKSSRQKETIEQTHARHILIRTGAQTSSEEARKSLLKLKQEIQSGEDFSDLAKQHSQDPGSRTKGGDLGWADPGTYVPVFEDVMSHLKDGQISEPFKSQFGWHIIQVLERRTKDKTDDNLRLQAKKVIHKRKAEEELQLWLRRILDESFIEYKISNLEPQ